MNRGCGWFLAGAMLLASLAFLAVAGAWGYRSFTVDRTWVPVTGEIVDLVLSRSSDDSDTYAPVIEYATGEGVTRTFQHTVSSGGLLVPDIGDPIDVLYDPEDPDHAIVRSTTGLWLGPAIFGALGILGLLTATLGMWGVRRMSRRSSAGGMASTSTLGRSGPTRSAEFRRVETDIDDTGVFRYRMVARGEDHAEYFGDWEDEDPTMELMAQGYGVMLVERGGRWTVVRV